MVTPCQKEQCTAYVLERRPDLSRRKVCKILDCSRTKIYYEKKMPTKDAIVLKLLKAKMGKTKKGRVKLTKLVQKEHPELSDSVIRRVYEQNGFALKANVKRKRLKKHANPIRESFMPNQEWAMDFMSDALHNGRKIRTLNIIDHFNRKCLGIFVAYSFTSETVIKILERVIEKHGKPKGIRTDNGPEFTSKILQKWLFDQEIEWVQIQAGKPQQNAIIERMNKTFREDVLDANVFRNIGGCQELADQWVEEYNEQRPHQALNYQTPKAYVA